MAIKFFSVKCPECGAALELEEGRKKLFCSYCGAKVLIDNENEHIVRHIDEAKLKQAEIELKKAELDKIKFLKKMEVAEKNRVAQEKIKAIKIKVSIPLGIVSICAMALGISTELDGLGLAGMYGLIILALIWLIGGKKENDEDDLGDKVKVPAIVSSCHSKDYATVEEAFLSAGFTNVKCIPLNDLKLGWLESPLMVSTITIKGESVTSGGKKFSPDVPVIISYHSYR